MNVTPPQTGAVRGDPGGGARLGFPAMSRTER